MTTHGAVTATPPQHAPHALRGQCEQPLTSAALHRLRPALTAAAAAAAAPSPSPSPSPSPA
eukprot:COSAG01_NODE_9984_length_2255_cov_8.679029_3_plen_60_part_01